MEEFRGGSSEVGLIASILSQAVKLAEVVIEPCLCIAVAAAEEAANKLDQCPRASVGCRISVTHLD